MGAIDGTHVHASVPVSKQIPFRGRKGTTTQNVLCICSFDMRFTFVYAGWEGSANDCRVLSAAMANPRLQFPRPPPGTYVFNEKKVMLLTIKLSYRKIIQLMLVEYHDQFINCLVGKYYVVDSGYASAPGFLTPFKGERYHLKDYRGGDRQPRTARELFNHKHSSLRNIIERSFAVLKNRFFILRHMPSFTIKKQARIVIACCTIHNYIRDEDKRDKNFELFGDPEHPYEPSDNDTMDDTSTEEGVEMNVLRKTIANKMARDRHMAEIP